MITYLKIEGAWLSPAANLDVVFFSVANRHTLMRKIWQACQDVFQFLLDVCEFRFAGFEFVTQVGNFHP